MGNAERLKTQKLLWWPSEARLAFVGWPLRKGTCSPKNALEFLMKKQIYLSLNSILGKFIECLSAQ